MPAASLYGSRRASSGIWNLFPVQSKKKCLRRYPNPGSSDLRLGEKHRIAYLDEHNNWTERTVSAAALPPRRCQRFITLEGKRPLR